MSSCFLATQWIANFNLLPIHFFYFADGHAEKMDEIQEPVKTYEWIECYHCEYNCQNLKTSTIITKTSIAYKFCKKCYTIYVQKIFTFRGCLSVFLDCDTLENLIPGINYTYKCCTTSLCNGAHSLKCYLKNVLPYLFMACLVSYSLK